MEPERRQRARSDQAAVLHRVRIDGAGEYVMDEDTSRGSDTGGRPPASARSLGLQSPPHVRPPVGARATSKGAAAAFTNRRGIAAQSSEWRHERERLSQRVKELELENANLRRGQDQDEDLTQWGGQQRRRASSLSNEQDRAATSEASAVTPPSSRAQVLHAQSFGGGERPRIGASASSGAGLTVAEAVAASHRARAARRLAGKPIQQYRSGYWNDASNVKSSFSCNNLAEMEEYLRSPPDASSSPPRAPATSSSNGSSGGALHAQAQAQASANARANRDSTAPQVTAASAVFLRRSLTEPMRLADAIPSPIREQFASSSDPDSSVMHSPPQQRHYFVETDIDDDAGSSDNEDVVTPRDELRRSRHHSQELPPQDSFRITKRTVSEPQVKRSSSDIRIWVGTWNMGAADPFSDKGGIVSAERSAFMLQPLIPHDYHLYVLGVQEGVSENVYHAVEAYLNRNNKGLRYHRMELKNNQFMLPNKNYQYEAVLDEVRGRGDGALVGTKFTGIAIFAAERVRDRIRLLRAGVHKFNVTSGSKGGVAAGLLINQTSIVFVNCHLDARNDANRREQIRNLNSNLAKVMGHPSFDLTEQFHHVVWMGDMNYRIVHLDPDIVLHMLEEGRTAELHDKFDGLLNDRRNGGVFDGFTEPNKFPNFYPTYKKFPKRGQVDDRVANWSKLVYRVLYKEPFYKGGKVKKRVPGWCDRILVHSLLVSDSKLMPEKVPNPFEDNGVWIDNYRSVNNGEGVDVSDHSPVCATFVLGFPQHAELLSPSSSRRQLRSLSSAVMEEPSREHSAMAGSYFDQPRVVRRIAATNPGRPVSTVLRIFNMALFWDESQGAVVPKKTRVVAPLTGEDTMQCDVVADRVHSRTGLLNLSLNAILQHTRPLELLHMLVWVKHESISGHCTLSLKRIARQLEGGEVKFRVPLYDHSMRLYVDGHPLVLVFSVRGKTFVK